MAGGATLAGAPFGLRDGNQHGEGVAPGNRRGGGAHRGGAAPARWQRRLQQRRSSVKGGRRWLAMKVRVLCGTGERRGGLGALNQRRGSTGGEAHRREAVGSDAWAKFSEEGGSPMTKLGQADMAGGGKPCT
jgi:hypothetical protein